MPTDTKLNQLIINQLTQEQYDEAKAAGTLSDTELYITDSDDDPQVKSNLSQTIDDSTTKYPSNKAVKDESSRITTLMDTKVSNCITEIPQDIKLELNNGTLTLKAGSKVYYNGLPVIIDSDKSLVVPTTFPTLPFIISVIPTKSELLQSEFKATSSSASNPGVNYAMWFNTTDNKCYINDGNANATMCSYPICIVNCVNGIGFTSIDQVFNGFGYIGSTIFALPGVKGLIPNGRNADGSLKSIEFSVDKVITATRDWTITNQANQHIGLGLNDFFFTNGYVDSLVMPTVNNYILWYNPRDNIMRYNNTDNTVTSIADYPIVEWMELGATGVGDNTSRITNLQLKTVFHALDYNDKSTISGWSMPSNRYIDLTLGASGRTYTAPANGWFFVSKKSTAATQEFVFENKSTNFSASQDSVAANRTIRLTISVKKGDNIYTYYTLGGSTDNFRFIYAEGEN